MPAKKPNSKSKSINISWKNVLVGLSVFFNLVFLAVIISLFFGTTNWVMANYSINKLTDSKGCFLAQDGTVRQDANGRALNGDGKVVCVQTLNPNDVK